MGAAARRARTAVMASSAIAAKSTALMRQCYDLAVLLSADNVTEADRVLARTHLEAYRADVDALSAAAGLPDREEA